MSSRRSRAALAVTAPTAAMSGASIGVAVVLIALALLALVAPVLTFGGVIVLAGVTALVAVGDRLRAPYLSATAVLLAGYAYGGRVFSYLGYPPIFIGEVLLAAGLVVALGCGAWHRLVHSGVAWAVALFVLWGVARTVPFVSEMGIDALRDAVVWGYAAYAVVIALSLRRPDVERSLHGYRRLAILLPAVVVCLFAITKALGPSAPSLPWAPEVSLATFKLGDVGVHLGGAAAFMLLGLGVPFRRAGTRVAWWGGWLLALALVAASSRGGFLSVVVAAGGAAFMGDVAARRTLSRVALAAVVIAALAVLYPAGTEDGAPVEGARQVSARQVLANVFSIVGSVGYGDAGGGYVNLDETKSWRLDWWTDIVGYTVAGDYFWQGKGFGVNLAEDDGYQVSPELPLRSPHNIHMTVLARGGVPGLLLWLGLNGAVVVALLRGWRRARLLGQARWQHLHTWLLAYWAAITVNATFDVYLEGPAGGIWFWSLIGFAIGALELQRHDAAWQPGAPVPAATAGAPCR